ncbi:class I SAM-dependent methyltransferase [Vibrio parahaemolyticus]|nr:class I SAM-dependent methyltransferase [Vibrio parahaemolyticus]
MAQDWDGLAKNWESNPATEQFAQSVFAQLQQLTQLDGIKVLDFGCGTGQFDLVVASSVLAFVDDVESSLDIAHSLLNEGGYFVHFDWVAESEQDGFTLSRSENALSNAGFVDVEAKKVFDITSDGQTMSVLMGVGRR